MKKLFAVLLAATMCLPMVNSAVKVHTIGDSTMESYDESTTDKRGWATYLGSFFNPEYVTVNNRGKSGSDTRRFYTNAAYWASVKSQMSEGDYLIIQFAHNDEGTVTYGTDNLELAEYYAANSMAAPTDDRGTNPQTTYRDMLRNFIDEAKALGVKPILMAPICRAYFQGNTIKRNGQHDLGDKFWKLEGGELLKDQSVPASDLSMSYVEAMRIVAKEKGVPFLNMTEATRELYLSYGESQCLSLMFVDKAPGQKDQTHTNAMGANLIARRAAQMMKDSNILAEYISIPTSVSANPSSIAIGETYSGVEQNKEFLLTGFGLEPESGNVSLHATGALTISTDKETYSKTLEVSYAGNTLFQKIYVRATYENEGAQNDSIVIESGDVHLRVPVMASVISLAGGSAVSATWALNAKPVPDAEVEGPVTAALTTSHMLAADTKDDVTDAAGTQITIARWHNADDEGKKANWPSTEIDENPTRYLDFAVTAPAKMEIRITGISFEIGAYSTGNMKCHINTGFGDEFTDVKTIYEAATSALTNIAPKLDADKNFADYGNPLNAVALTPMLTIPAGETLHVRVLPWHEHTSGSGKYICLYNMKIEGQAFESAQGIENLSQPLPKEGVKVLRDGVLLIEHNGVIYNAQGMKVK